MPAMTMVIRAATARDLGGMLRLWREMWDGQAALDPRFTSGPLAERTMRAMLEGHLENERSRLVVAEDGGAVVGYALGTIMENPPVVVDPAFGYVSDVAVTAAARRKGAGTRLVDALHDWFRSKGLRSAELQVSIRNEASRAFWRRRGYTDFVERLHCRL